MTKDQKRFLGEILGSGHLQQYSKKAYKNFIKPYDAEKYEEFYNSTFIDPAKKALKREIIPTIKENFLGLDESGSSALNRALAQSASDLSGMLGQGMLQQYNQHNANRLSALSGVGGLAGQQTFTPLISQQQGLAGPMIQGASALGAAALLSSREYKENIKPFEKGLEALKKMQAYQYDYKKEYSGSKDEIGVMVEDCPEEIIEEIGDLKGVNLYGLVGLLVNCVNELNKKIESLESKEA